MRGDIHSCRSKPVEIVTDGLGAELVSAGPLPIEWVTDWMLVGRMLSVPATRWSNCGRCQIRMGRRLEALRLGGNRCYPGR
jgi:hypothetical protein